ITESDVEHGGHEVVSNACLCRRPAAANFPTRALAKWAWPRRRAPEQPWPREMSNYCSGCQRAGDLQLCVCAGPPHGDRQAGPAMGLAAITTLEDSDVTTDA